MDITLPLPIAICIDLTNFGSIYEIAAAAGLALYGFTNMNDFHTQYFLTKNEDENKLIESIDSIDDYIEQTINELEDINRTISDGRNYINGDGLHIHSSDQKLTSGRTCKEQISKKRKKLKSLKEKVVAKRKELIYSSSPHFLFIGIQSFVMILMAGLFNDDCEKEIASICCVSLLVSNLVYLVYHLLMFKGTKSIDINAKRLWDVVGLVAIFYFSSFLVGYGLRYLLVESKIIVPIFSLLNLLGYIISILSPFFILYHRYDKILSIHINASDYSVNADGIKEDVVALFNTFTGFGIDN